MVVIDRIAGVIKATHPDFEYQPLSPPEERGDAGRVRWVSGTPGKPPAYAGTDFIVARNGRIASHEKGAVDECVKEAWGWDVPRRMHDLKAAKALIVPT